MYKKITYCRENMTLSKKIIRKLCLLILRANGSTPFMSSLKVESLLVDLYDKKIPVRDKIWAYKRGFLSRNVKNYGLTQENYKNYLSDLAYSKMYPLNGSYKVWIDDKLTIKMILSEFKEFLPKYYYLIRKNGQILALHDLKNKYEVTEQGIIDLIHEEKVVVAKKVSGSAGSGFYKLCHNSEGYFINDESVSHEELIKRINTLKDYIISEYIKTHHDLAKYNPNSGNTIRVMVINERGNDAFVANAMLKIGTQKTGSVDFTRDGGVCALIDIETGFYGNAKEVKMLEVVNSIYHPDSQLKVEGILPHWDGLKQKLIEISHYLSEIRYLGYDVIITEDSYKIIEINSNQSIDWFQYYYPLLKENPASDFFKSLLK